MRVVKRVAIALVVVASLAGCGGGSSPGVEGEAEASDDALATLEVISTDVTVQGADDSQPSSSQTGTALDVGDTVRTDPSGFAEIGFFDGSLTRVENAATFTLTDLQDTEAAAVVDTDLQTGRSWNRIQDLSESETWTQATPVAQATVRGTAYAADCTPDPQTCLFTVVEGTVELQLPDGTTITLTARQQVALTREQPPGEIEDLTTEQLADNEWVTRNRALDEGATADQSSPTSEEAQSPSLDDILGGGPGDCTATVEITGALSVSTSGVPTELSAESLFLTTSGVEVSASNRDGRNFVQISTTSLGDVWAGSGLMISPDATSASVQGTYEADGSSGPISADIDVACPNSDSGTVDS